MALIECHECEAQISSKAKACPSCGAEPEKSPFTTGRVIFAILAIFFIGRAALDTASPPKPPRSVEQIAADQERERRFQSAVSRIKSLKSNLKNPSSFELVDAMRLDSGVLCVTYRGTNSFNAVTTERKAIDADGSLLSYDQKCAGKSGESMKHVGYAL